MEIAANLMKPSEEDKAASSGDEDPEARATPPLEPEAKKAAPTKVDPKPKGKGPEIAVEEEPDEKSVEVIEDKFEANDYMLKVDMLPPQDPDGTQTIHENLIVS